MKSPGFGVQIPTEITFLNQNQRLRMPQIRVLDLWSVQSSPEPVTFQPRPAGSHAFHMDSGMRSE